MKSFSIKDQVFQSSAGFLQWFSLTDLSSTNGAPSLGADGIDISKHQKAKLVASPLGGATIDFRIWFLYEGLSDWFVVDGSERNNITENWTQELEVSGVERIYIEVLAINAGTAEFNIALAEDQETLVGFKRIGNWEEAGTGDQDGDLMVWTNDLGQQAVFEWDASLLKWVLQSTHEKWFLVDDWSSGTINTELWTVTTLGNLVDYTVNSSANRIELNYTAGASTTSEDINIEAAFQIHTSVEVYGEMSLNAPTSPTTGAMSIRSVIYYNTPLDDGINSFLELTTAESRFRVFDRPVGGGATEQMTYLLANDALFYDCYASAKDTLGIETLFNAGFTSNGSSTFVSSTIATASDFSHAISSNNAKFSWFSSSAADVANTLYLGPVYVRR